MAQESCRLFERRQFRSVDTFDRGVVQRLIKLSSNDSVQDAT